MTDPEKMTPEVEESSVNSPAEAQAPEATIVEAAAEVSAPVESEESAEVAAPIAEALAEAVAEEAAEEAMAEAEKNVHTMSKEELLAQLREIVATENVNAHKDVVAIRQALYSIRQREVNEELKAFVEQGGDPTAFSSTPDECENETKELIAKFREFRSAFLEAESRRQEENLARKKEIIAEMKSIAADADNVNVQFQNSRNCSRLSAAWELCPRRPLRKSGRNSRLYRSSSMTL